MDIHATVKRLKQQKSGQVSKLLLKSEAEMELLETIRDYMSRRAEIEGNYSKQLEKLSKGTAGRKFRKVFGNLPPLPITDPNVPSKVTYQAFAALISESEKHARSRGHMSEQLTEFVVRSIKDFNKEKAMNSKKLIDFGFKYKEEFLETYDELNKAKQNYDTLAKDTAHSKEKYEKMLSKPKTALGSLKVFVTGKDEEERKKKWKTNTRKLTDARNDYILTLAAINAMQNSYYQNDLPNLMKDLDGDYYSTLTTMLNKYVALEETSTDGLQYTINLLTNKIPEITRERDMGDFLKDYDTIFERPSQFVFEMHSADDSKEVTVDDVTKVVLGQKLGLLVVQEEEISNQLSIKENELKALKKMAGVFTDTPAFGNASSTLQQEQDLNTEIDHLKFRLSRIYPRMKILQDLKVEAIMPPLPKEKTNSTNAKKQQEFKKQAVALYSYTAQNDDEINIIEGEELDIVENDIEGWTKVKNAMSGNFGIVPTNYLTITTASLSRQISNIADIPAPSLGAQYVVAVYDYDASDEGEISYKAGDKIEVLEADQAEEWWEGKVTRTGDSGSFQILFTQGWETIQTKFLKPPSGLRRGDSKTSTRSGVSTEMKARVLYDYTASGEDEISLKANETITIITKNTGGPDWWQGENSAHQRGQFPSSYVEEIYHGSLPRSITTNRSESPSLGSAKALYDYNAMANDELSIKEGDIINLVDTSDSDWWKGELDGQIGTFPANYVEKL